VLFDDRIEDPLVRAQCEEIARARSGLDQAEVSMRQARLQLARSRVQAPFRGRIADLEVVPGQHVTVGAELMTVVDLDPIHVEVSVLEAELGLLGEGRRASVRFAAFSGESFEGRIESVNPVVGPEQRTGRVVVLLPNPGGLIKPGMYAEVSLAATSFPDRLLVPRAAILERVRPILMTSATTILGLLPLVLFSGADANIWNALALTLIGGLLLSTLLVITVTPAIYTLFEARPRA